MNVPDSTFSTQSPSLEKASSKPVHLNSPIDEKVNESGHIRLQNFQQILNANSEIQSKITVIKQTINSHSVDKQHIQSSTTTKKFQEHFESTKAQTEPNKNSIDFEFKLISLDDFNSFKLLLNDLMQKQTYDATELSFIFALAGFDPALVQKQRLADRQLDKKIEKLEVWQKLYIDYSSEVKEFIPLLNEKAHHFLQTRPFNLSVQAAANTGKAATTGLEFLTKSRSERQFFDKFGNSAQDVYIYDNRAVYKKSNAKSAEEESNISSLFNLVSKQGVVGSFKISNTRNLERFGINKNYEEFKRSIPLELSDPAARNTLVNYLSPEDDIILANLDQQKNIFESLKDQQVACKPGEQTNWELYTIEELNEMYREGKLDSSFKIGVQNYEVPLLSYLNRTENLNLFIVALSYDQDASYSFTPDFLSSSEQESYQKCEKFQWFCVDTND